MLLPYLIIGYIIGYSLCYFWFRAIIRDRRQSSWILMEKLVVIVLSLLSWVALTGCVLLILIGPLFKIDFDKECKW